MSVVLSYANKDIAIIACDGRVVDAYNNIINESYKKYIRVNNSVILGYAGELQPCECVAKLLTNPENMGFIKSLSFEDVHNFIVQYCTTFPSGTRYGFILLGIGRNHKIITSNITYYTSPQMQYIDGNDIVYHALYPSELQKEDIFKNYLLIQDPINAIKSTIRYCAQRSPSVNETVYLDYIQLDPAKAV